MPDAGKPRNGCLSYCQNNPSVKAPICLTLSLFNDLCHQKKFIDGPRLDAFGDGDGEPYNPWRQAYGTIQLDQGKQIVFAETNPSENQVAIDSGEARQQL